MALTNKDIKYRAKNDTLLAEIRESKQLEEIAIRPVTQLSEKDIYALMALACAMVAEWKWQEKENS